MERHGRGPSGGHEERFYTPDASPFRRAVEQRSAPFLLVVRRAPRWLAPLVPVALLLIGLAASNATIGAMALLVLVLALGFLAYLSWPALSGSGRTLRSLALLVLLGLAALRLLGRL